jgi:L-threonylcarbamoyladenylate synthase
MALTVPVNLSHPDDRPLILAAEVLQAGGVIVYPTDTVYGIGADALNGAAVEKVHRVKHRAEKKPILILVPDPVSAEVLVAEVPEAARALMDAFWPGPLTLVFRALPGLPEALTHGQGTVGIRVPASHLCLRLLRLAGCPLTSTSANISGGPSPDTVNGIRKILGSDVDLYLDAGRLDTVSPSTVVDITTSPPRIVREGAVGSKDLQAVLPALAGVPPAL